MKQIFALAVVAATCLPLAYQRDDPPTKQFAMLGDKITLTRDWKVVDKNVEIIFTGSEDIENSVKARNWLRCHGFKVVKHKPAQTRSVRRYGTAERWAVIFPEGHTFTIRELHTSAIVKLLLVFKKHDNPPDLPYAGVNMVITVPGGRIP